MPSSPGPLVALGSLACGGTEWLQCHNVMHRKPLQSQAMGQNALVAGSSGAVSWMLEMLSLDPLSMTSVDFNTTTHTVGQARLPDLPRTDGNMTKSPSKPSG